MNISIAYTESVVIELSNFCNLAADHKKCPLHLQWPTRSSANTPTMLSSKVVSQILDELAGMGYTKDLGFSVYNEPLLDPRLYYFIRYAKEVMPQVCINIWTNGTFLTRAFAEELHELGVYRIVISSYGGIVEPVTRFRGLSYVTFTSGVLDDRLSLYTQKIEHRGEPCGAPLRQIVINCRGDVGLCCMDWKWTKTFGNLHTETLQQILDKSEMLQVHNDLRLGIRDSYPCCHCRYTR